MVEITLNEGSNYRSAIQLSGMEFFFVTGLLTRGKWHGQSEYDSDEDKISYNLPNKTQVKEICKTLDLTEKEFWKRCRDQLSHCLADVHMKCQKMEG